MRCERCQGLGWVIELGDMIGGKPCPECNGGGIAHCCDGLREQPENEDGEKAQA